MSPYQFALQIRHVLRALTWPGGDFVFGNDVYAVAELPDDESLASAIPAAFIVSAGAEADDQEPTQLETTFEIGWATQIFGDPLGEFGVIGGAIGSSTGAASRGVLEIAAPVRAALEKLTGSDGALAQVSDLSEPVTRALDNGGHLVMASTTLTVQCQSANYYAAPQQLAHDGSTFSWVGGQCSNRFDFVRYVLVSAAGSIPDAPADGLEHYRGTADAFTAPRQAGRVYVIFAEYDSRLGVHAASVEGHSAAERGSYLEP